VLGLWIWIGVLSLIALALSAWVKWKIAAGALILSTDRLNLAATLAAELHRKSFLSKATSLFNHKPLTSIFFPLYKSFHL